MENRFKILAVLLAALIYACGSPDSHSSIQICDKDSISSPKLISVEDAVEAMLIDSTIITLEISNQAEYKSGHLPNALNVWRPDFRSKEFKTYKGMICSDQELQGFLQNLGVSQHSHLLLYDNKGGCDAMRLSWVFDCYGISNYQIINGGKQAWKEANQPLDTSSERSIKKTNFLIDVSLDSSLYATRFDILNALDDDNTIIVDTREPYEFEAKPFISGNQVWPYKKGAYTRGSIPGAIHLNWSVLSDFANDHRIKCKKDLIYDLESKGITNDKNIIVYCQSGSRSSHTAFVLREILGYPNVKNYDGSWIEWSYYHVNGNQVPIHQMTAETAFNTMRTKLMEDIKDKNG